MHHAQRTPPARTATVLVLAMALLATTGLLVPVMLAASVRADTALLSEGRPALALTRKSDAFLARNAVDGNPETRWTSRPEDPQWLRVDLEQTADVRRVEIDWGAAYSTAYSIQISDDGAAWSTLWFTDGSDGGTDVITVAGGGDGRYVRIRSVTRSGSAGIAIREIRVYGWRENEEPVETGIPAPAPGASPKPSNPNPSPKPTPTPTRSPAPAASSPPTAPTTTAPTPSTRPTPAPSRNAPTKDASGEGPPGSSPKPSASPSSSSRGEAGAVQGAEAAAAVGPIVPILYAVGVMAGLVALGIWLGRRQQRGAD